MSCEDLSIWDDVNVVHLFRSKISQRFQKSHLENCAINSTGGAWARVPKSTLTTFFGEAFMCVELDACFTTALPEFRRWIKKLKEECGITDQRIVPQIPELDKLMT